jgi:mannose-1-phosphate guanylyltransferase
MPSFYIGIMAGGKGERFWPLSRKTLPKQLLSLVTEKTLIEETLERVLPLTEREKIFFVTTSLLESYFEKKFKGFHLLVEPVGKNTAPACLFASYWVFKRDKDALLAMLPADHVIRTKESFAENINFAKKIADEGYIVTFGIIPTRPETGYGYIERGELILSNKFKAYRVEAFHEKPDREKAERYLASKRFYWNSGMFLWKVSTILEAYRKYMPELYELLGEYPLDKGENIRIFYERAPSISVDYGIMEKAENIAVIEASFEWEDVGSYLALEKFFDKDGTGNIKRGDVVSVNCRNNIFIADRGLVASYGVDDLIVVHTEDVTLVIPKKDKEKVKVILAELKKLDKFKKYL